VICTADWVGFGIGHGSSPQRQMRARGMGRGGEGWGGMERGGMEKSDGGGR